jgi:hypothetical protein
VGLISKLIHAPNHELDELDKIPPVNVLIEGFWLTAYLV